MKIIETSVVLLGLAIAISISVLSLIFSLTIPNDTISTKKIKNKSITSSKIGKNEVKNENIEDGAITLDKIDDDVILTISDIPSNSIGTEELVDNSVTHSKLSDNSVKGDKIENDAITNSKIANNSITLDKTNFDSSPFKVSTGDTDFSLLGTKDVDDNDNTKLLLYSVNHATNPGLVKTCVPSTGKYVLCIDNVEKFVIDSNGRIGINKTVPTHELNVNGESLFEGDIIISNSDHILNVGTYGTTINDNTGFQVKGNQSVQMSVADDLNNQVVFYSRDDVGNGYGEIKAINPNSGNLPLKINPQETTIFGNYNIPLNNLNKVEIDGIAYINNKLSISNANDTTTRTDRKIEINAGDGNLLKNSYRVDNGDFLSTAPIGIEEVFGLDGSNNRYKIFYEDVDTDDPLFKIASNENVSYKPFNVQTAQSNVSFFNTFSTATSSFRFGIDGTGMFNNFDLDQISFGTTTNSDFIFKRNGDNEKLRITNDGITVTGNVTYTGALLPSDVRLKKDIKNISLEESKIWLNELEPKEFKYTKNNNELKVGFIAQDIQTIIEKNQLKRELTSIYKDFIKLDPIKIQLQFKEKTKDNMFLYENKKEAFHLFEKIEIGTKFKSSVSNNKNDFILELIKKGDDGLIFKSEVPLKFENNEKILEKLKNLNKIKQNLQFSKQFYDKEIKSENKKDKDYIEKQKKLLFKLEKCKEKIKLTEHELKNIYNCGVDVTIKEILVEDILYLKQENLTHLLLPAIKNMAKEMEEIKTQLKEKDSSLQQIKKENNNLKKKLKLNENEMNNILQKIENRLSYLEKPL